MYILLEDLGPASKMITVPGVIFNGGGGSGSGIRWGLSCVSPLGGGGGKVVGCLAYVR